MGVPKTRILPTTGEDSEIEVVYQFDPCVTVRDDGLVGWVPKGDADLSDVDGETADVVTIRPIDGSAMMVANDAGGTRATNFARARRGCVAINGVRKRKVIDAWFDQVARLDDTALVLLGLYVAALARGGDAARAMRIALGEDEPVKDAAEED